MFNSRRITIVTFVIPREISNFTVSFHRDIVIRSAGVIGLVSLNSQKETNTLLCPSLALLLSGKKKKRGQRAADPNKSGRGLRQFSMKVCEKVESKGRTTYNEVADELVAELAAV